MANKKYKYSPAGVLKGIQELYEAKLVTYPRTDCNYITEGEFEYLKNNLNGYQSIVGLNFQPHSLTANKRYVDNKKVQEHYAIVLTKNVPSKKRSQIDGYTEKFIYRSFKKCIKHVPFALYV